MSPHPPERRAPAAAAMLLAALAVAPAVLPGIEVYFDNGCHLLEVAELARRILPEDRWFTGWSDAANVGFAVNQINAPLPWTALGVLAALGVPVLPLYVVCILLSNGVLAWGTYRLLRQLGADPGGAFAGAVLAATLPADLWGVGGTAAGMWPFRVANGLFLAGLATPEERRTLPGTATWLATLLLCHTFTALVAFSLTALQAVHRLCTGDRRLAVRLAGGLLVATALTAFFWVPLREPALRAFAAPWRYSVVQALAMGLLAVDPIRLQIDGGLSWPGGWTDALAPGLCAVGAGLFLFHRMRTPQPSTRLPRELLLTVLLLGLATVAWVPLTGTGALGPNPWRHLAFARIALAVLAGLGITALRPPRWAVLAAGAGLALLAARTGLHEVPQDPAARADLADLRATWDVVRAAGVEGPIYHQDPFGDPHGPPSLAKTHPGVGLTLATGLPTLGTWYAVAPIPTLGLTLAVQGWVLGAPLNRWKPTALSDRLRLYGVDAVVSTNPLLAALLDADPVWTRLPAPFPLHVRSGPRLDPVGVPPDRGRATARTTARGLLIADLEGEGSLPFRVRRTWHPWWRATLDGVPVGLVEGEETGLVEGIAPGPGRLEVRWEDRDRTGKAVSLLGLATLALLLWPWRRSSQIPR